LIKLDLGAITVLAAVCIILVGVVEVHAIKKKYKEEN